MQSRRDFLGSVACAFAAAGVACRVPGWATVEIPERLQIGPWLYWCDKDGLIEYNGRVLVGAVEHPREIQWSVLQDPTSWDVA